MAPVIDIRILYYFLFIFSGLGRNSILMSFCAVIGIYLAETINKFLGSNWRKFAGQNYFDPRGLFLSVLWSGPLLLIAIIILVSDQSHLYVCFIFNMPGAMPLFYYFETLNHPFHVAVEYPFFVMPIDGQVETSRAQAPGTGC